MRAVLISLVNLMSIEEEPQILRLTTPKLNCVWGPVRSEEQRHSFQDSADEFRVLQPVENVAAQRMALGKIGVIEVVGSVVRHADVFHHAPRAQVAGHGEGHERG